jgi:hypothetical protein
MERTNIRQLRSLQALDISKPQIVEAIQSFTEMTHDILPQDLKQELRSKSLNTYVNFIDSFSVITAQIYQLKSSTDNLVNKLDKLSSHTSRIIDSTHNAIKQGKKLQSSNEEISLKSKVLDNLLSRVSLTDEMKNTLTSSDKPIGDEFFACLEKLNKINELILMIDNAENRVLKFSIEEYITSIQETAFERLFRYVQHQCKLLEKDNIELLPYFNKAIHHLRDRPVYFNHCTAEIIKFRQQHFSYKLNIYINSASDRKTDSMLAVGEILAWLHTNLVAEHNLLCGLLGSMESIHQEDILQEATLLDRIADSLTKQMAYYIDSKLYSLNCIETLQALSLFDYYLEKLIQDELLSYSSKFTEKMYAYKLACEDRLSEILNNSAHQVKLFGITADFRLPIVFSEKLNEVDELCRILNQQQHLNHLFKIISEQFLEECINFYKNEVYRSKQEIQAIAFIINLLTTLKFKLSDYDFAISLTSSIEDELKDLEKRYISLVSDAVIDKYSLRSPDQSNLYTFIKDLTSEKIQSLQEVNIIDNINLKLRIKQLIGNKLIECYTQAYNISHDKQVLKAPGELSPFLIL